MRINDYKNYDVLNLYVKRNKLEDIINKYSIFGWELEKQEDNKQYGTYLFRVQEEVYRLPRTMLPVPSDSVRTHLK